MRQAFVLCVSALVLLGVVGACRRHLRPWQLISCSQLTAADRLRHRIRISLLHI